MQGAPTLINTQYICVCVNISSIKVFTLREDDILIRKILNANPAL